MASLKHTFLHRIELTTQPKDRRPPKVFFSRCPLVFVLLKKKKKEKKEGARQTRDQPPFSNARKNDLAFEPSPGDGAGVFLCAFRLLVFAVQSKCVWLACGGGAPGWLWCVPLFFSFFSVPVGGVHAFLKRKNEKQEKEGDEQGTSHLTPSPPSFLCAPPAFVP